MSDCGCTDRYDFCVIRGDYFKLDVGLSAAYVEVLEDPTHYVMNLVFREDQEDDLVPYLTLEASAEIIVDPAPTDASVMFRFNATAADTQALPEYDIVAYCELVFIPDVGINPPQPQRIFNSDVEIND